MVPPRSRAGFTLIELMIVVSIIGVLSAIALPKFADLVRKSKEAATKGQLGSVRSAISIYYADTEGVFPFDDLTCLTTHTKYIRRIPEAFVSAHQSASAIVQNNDALGMAGLVMMDNGQWKYWNWVGASWGGVSQGHFWMGCLHADTKGAVWSTE